MNKPSQIQSFEDGVKQIADDLRDFVERDPAQAVVLGFSAGLLLHLLPTKSLLGAAATVGARLVHPALLTLGAIKAMELCCGEKPRT